jgi:feruloyl esterase
LRSRLSICAMVVIALTGAVLAASAGAKPARSIPGVMRADSSPAPVIAPKLACGSLVQSFTDPTTPGVPDLSMLPGFETRITSASVVAATSTTPEYCDVHGYISGQIGFELKLPTTTYQGRYLQNGCAGYCGTVIPPSFPACDAQLGGDFATSSTNDGFENPTTNFFDALAGAEDEAIRIDYGYRAVHAVAVVSKIIIAGFYGAPPRTSYFVGCSDGGREGLMEAERYPTDFNGIIAGAPGNYMGFLPTEDSAWVSKANTDANGNPILTADKLPALHQAVLNECDALDGLKDGQITDPRLCHFDPASVQCPAGTDQPTCLTAAQVAVVRKIYESPQTPDGKLLYPGPFEPGSELGWLGWIVPPAGEPMAAAGSTIAAENFLRYMGLPIGQGSTLANWQFTEQDFHRLLDQALIYSSISPNLTKFRAAGGKLIVYQGWADNLIPPGGTINWYRDVEQTMGGPRSTRQFARLFMFPDMLHCAGQGPTPNVSRDVIDQLVQWVESGTAPDALIGYQTDAQGNVIRSRPVFPYPKVARYSGSGSVDDYHSFVPSRPLVRGQDRIEWLGSDLM